MNSFNASNYDGLNRQGLVDDQQNWNLHNFPLSSAANTASFGSDGHQYLPTQNFSNQNFYGQNAIANGIPENALPIYRSPSFLDFGNNENRSYLNYPYTSSNGHFVPNLMADGRNLNGLEKLFLASQMTENRNEAYPTNSEMQQSSLDVSRYNLRPRRVNNGLEYSRRGRNKRHTQNPEVSLAGSVTGQEGSMMYSQLNHYNATQPSSYFIPNSNYSYQNCSQTSGCASHAGRNQENVTGNLKDYNVEKKRKMFDSGVEPVLIDLTKDDGVAANTTDELSAQASFRQPEMNINERLRGNKNHSTEEIDIGQLLLKLNSHQSDGSSMLQVNQGNEEDARVVNRSGLFASISDQVLQSMQRDRIHYNNFHVDTQRPLNYGESNNKSNLYLHQSQNLNHLLNLSSQGKFPSYGQFASSLVSSSSRSREVHQSFNPKVKTPVSCQNQQPSFNLYRMRTRSQLHNSFGITSTLEDPLRPNSFTPQGIPADSQSSGELSKRSRATYSQQQVEILEEAFQINKYVSRDMRGNLSQKIGVSEKQIKVWFQNRRMRDKKKDPNVRMRGRKHKRSAASQGRASNENFKHKVALNMFSNADEATTGIKSPDQAFECPPVKTPTFPAAQLTHPNYPATSYYHNPVPNASYSNFQNPFILGPSFSTAQPVSSFSSPAPPYSCDYTCFPIDCTAPAQPTAIIQSPQNPFIPVTESVDETGTVNFNALSDSSRSTPSLVIELTSERSSADAPKSIHSDNPCEGSQYSQSAGQCRKDLSSSTSESPPNLEREEHCERLSADLAEAVLSNGSQCVVSSSTDSSEKLEYADIPNLSPVVPVKKQPSDVENSYHNSGEISSSSRSTALPTSSDSCLDANYNDEHLLSLVKMIAKYPPSEDESKIQEGGLELYKSKHKNNLDQNFQSCSPTFSYVPPSCNLLATDNSKSGSISGDINWPLQANTSRNQTPISPAQSTNMSYSTSPNTAYGHNEVYTSCSEPVNPPVPSINISTNLLNEPISPPMQYRMKTSHLPESNVAQRATIQNSSIMSNSQINALMSESMYRNDPPRNSNFAISNNTIQTQYGETVIKEEPVDEYSTEIGSDSFLFSSRPRASNVNVSTAQTNCFRPTNRISSAFINPSPPFRDASSSNNCTGGYMAQPLPSNVVRPTFPQGYNHMFAGQGGNLYSYQNQSYTDNYNSSESSPELTRL